MKSFVALANCMILALLCGAACAEQPAPGVSGDSALAAAERYVRKSDRYLHHSRLRRGMKGYGLTVMSGVRIARFDVEIISVVEGWGPHQDVILARLSGKDVGGVNIAVSGIISGMSGSPVYVQDPADGKYKIIGAVSYGWYAQKEAQCGLQPITQMIAVAGFLSTGEEKDNKGKEGVVAAGAGARAPREYLAAVLNPRKADFSKMFRPARPALSGPPARASRLTPLAMPLMI